MTRLWCALIVVAVCAGCRNSPPVMDPFLGTQTVPPPGTAVLAPNAAVAPPYYGATTSPPASTTIVSPPVTSPTPAVPPVTPAAPPTTAPYEYQMPPNYRPAAAGLNSVTPNVSPPGGQLVQPAAGAQPLATLPAAGNRPAYPPPGGMAFQQAPTAQAAQQPTRAHQTPPGLLPPASTAGARDIRSSAGTPIAAAPGWQAADNNRAAAVDSASASDSSAANISPNSGGAIRIVEPMRSTQPASTAAAPARTPTEFRPGNTSTLTPASGAMNRTTGSAPIRDLADLPPVQTASFQGTPAAASAAAPASASSSNYGYEAQYRWVKGKLEYSQSARTWRLRYIPPDAANDNYGGSVILSDAGNRLSSFQHGDFVVAYGTIGQSGIDNGSFAAMYNVSQIQRQ